MRRRAEFSCVGIIVDVEQACKNFFRNSKIRLLEKNLGIKFEFSH